MFLLSVLVCLSAFCYCKTPLYVYSQALCQILASNDGESKSCDMLSKKQILFASSKNSSPDHLFDLKFLHSMLYIIG